MFLYNLIVLVCNFCFSNSPSNKANIFLGLIEYELNSLLGASHLVDYISVPIRFDLERYLLIILKRVIWRIQMYNLFREIFKFRGDKSNNICREILKCFRKPRNLNFSRKYIWNLQITHFKMIYDMFVF